MDSKTKGAWIIYQAGKMSKMNVVNKFEISQTAGKAGILLSAISQDKNDDLNNQRLYALASASNLSRLETDSLIKLLRDQELVDIGKNGIQVLGVTSSSILTHTAQIYNELGPTNIENASIDLCEEASVKPHYKNEIGEVLSDTYEITKDDLDLLFDYSFQIGFVDKEEIAGKDDVIFNGNLFKRNNIEKIDRVLSSLKQEEQRKLIEFNNYLNEISCVTRETAIKIMGQQLFEKLTSIGLFDVNLVSNNIEEVYYITKPAAFSKYGQAFEDDIFDLAKMFVSSLTYGMTKSSHQRGRITMIEDLLRKLINGYEVGPIPAIGEDYKILEQKNVISVYHGSKKNYYGQTRSGYMMKLLKKEVGEIALAAITKKDASFESLSVLPSAAVNKYRGPEDNREIYRKSELKKNPKDTNDLILALRTGGRN